MSRMFDEVMGLGEFADSSRSSSSLPKTGDPNFAQADKVPGAVDDDSNDSRQEDRWDEGGEDLSSPQASPTDRTSLHTKGAKDGDTSDVPFDDAIDGLPTFVPEDDEEWNFSLPVGSLEDADNLKMKRSSQGNDEMSLKKKQKDNADKDPRGRNGTSGSADTSKEHTPDNSRDSGELNRVGGTDDSQIEENTPAEDPPMSPIANIKDEPIDEGYDAALLPQGSITEIKEELEQEEEQLRISSVYSVGGANSFAPPMAPTPVLASALAPAPPPGPTAILFPTRGGTVLQTIPLKPAVTLPSSQTIVSVAPVRPPPPPPIPGSVRCSGCSKVLLKGQTAFQRKGSTQLFCSTMCLTGHLPPANKVIGRSCSQCNKEILQPRDMITIPTEEKTYLYFCGQFCLSVFRHKNKQPEKLLEKWAPEKRLEKKAEKPPEKPVERQQPDRCSVCRVINRIEHEVSHQGRIHKLCSDACFVTWRRIRQLALNCCEGCGLYCSSNSTSCQTLTIENIQINFCGLTCVSTFAQTSKKLIDCAKCRKMVVVSSALMERDAKGKVQLFCSQACAERGRPAGHLLNGTTFPCSHCKVMAVPQYHLAMVDGTIRNFCSHDCVSTFRKYGLDMINGIFPLKECVSKESPKLGPTSGANSVPSFAQDLQSSVSYPGHQHVNSSVPPLASPYPAMSSPSVPAMGQANSPPNQTEAGDSSKVTCHHCSKRIYTKPLLLSYKGRISVFCSSTCSDLYKSQKNIVVTCDACKQEKVLHDILNYNQQDVFFCSENCKVGYRNNDLWRSCSYCSSVSQKMLHSHYGGKVEEFCRPNCMSQFTVLYYGMGRCDNCRKQGYQSEKLQCLGSVRNFCNITCLLHYCNMYFEKHHHATSNGTGTAPQNPHAPTQPNDSPKMNPIIADVVSLANGSATQPNATTDAALTGSIPSSTSEGKSQDHASTQTDGMRLSVPRRRQMKNKSVLCRPFTLDQESMCQFASTSTDSPAVSVDDSPAALERVRMVMVPIPVPVFIPVPMQMYSECTPIPMAMPVPVPVPVMVQPPRKVVSDASVQMDPVAEETPPPALSDHRVDSPPEEVAQSNQPASEAVELEAASEGTAESTLAQVPAPSDLLRPPSPLMDLESDFPAALLAFRSRQRGVKRSRGGGDGSYPRKRGRKKKGLDRSALVPSESPALDQQYGVNAWVHWVRQLRLDSEASMVNEDLLQCDSTQLSHALSRFVKEVRRPNGQSYSPDSVLYLCLGIQQYLFTNGRMENLFTDELYSPFASELSGMLQTWRPAPLTRGGLVSSRVHESYLWECKQLGSYSPIVLLNTVLFFCAKGFRLHSLEQHQRLCFSDLTSRSKPSALEGKVQYLEYQPGGAASSSGETDLKLELLENVSDPRHCPVRLYEFYLSRCPESAKRRPGLFYLQPEKNVTHSPHWFSSQPLDGATLQSMLSRVLAVKEVIQQPRGPGRLPPPLYS